MTKAMFVRRFFPSWWALLKKSQTLGYWHPSDWLLESWPLPPNYNAPTGYKLPKPPGLKRPKPVLVPKVH